MCQNHHHSRVFKVAGLFQKAIIRKFLERETLLWSFWQLLPPNVWKYGVYDMKLSDSCTLLGSKG